MQYKDPKLLEALWSYIAKFHVQEHLFPPPSPANPPPFNDSVLGLPPHRHKNTLTDELWVVIPKNDKCPGAGKNNVYCSYMLET